MNTPYELHKVEREIKTHGSAYSFERIPVDDYGEYKLGEPREQVCTINGIYHISKGYIAQTGTDASTVRSKGQPMTMFRGDFQGKYGHRAAWKSPIVSRTGQTTPRRFVMFG